MVNEHTAVVFILKSVRRNARRQMIISFFLNLFVNVTNVPSKFCSQYTQKISSGPQVKSKKRTSFYFMVGLTQIS